MDRRTKRRYGRFWIRRKIKSPIRRQTEEGLKGDQQMLVAKKAVSEKINVVNKKPMIRKNQTTGEMVGGFLDPETGVFEAAMEINNERDIDEFLEEYDLSVVMISKM